jgi:hypothetical protein
MYRTMELYFAHRVPVEACGIDPKDSDPDVGVAHVRSMTIISTSMWRPEFTTRILCLPTCRLSKRTKISRGLLRIQLSFTTACAIEPLDNTVSSSSLNIAIFVHRNDLVHFYTFRPPDNVIVEWFHVIALHDRCAS